jgi:methionyl-tRNA synthetase
MLKAEGSYILPDNVPANEFLNLEGNKLSTSKNWAVWLHEYLEDFPGQQDVLRYALTSNARKLRIMILLGKIFKRETTMN